MAVSFGLQGAKGAKEKYIRILWTHGDATVRSTFGQKIYQEYWESGHVKAAKDTVINSSGCKAGEMSALLDAIRWHCDSIKGTNDEVTSGELVTAFENILYIAQKEAKQGLHISSMHWLVDVYDSFMEKEGTKRNWSTGTLIHYKKTRRLILEFSPNIKVEEITLSWMEKFYAHLNTKLGERTVDTMMINLRSFLHWASTQYSIDETIAQFTYKTRKNIKDLVYLDVNEIKRLAELNVSEDGDNWEIRRKGKMTTIHRRKEDIERARDMFLFCCMTGLRFSDMQRLRWVHVFSDCIKLYTKKTMRRVEVALNPISYEILDRYDASRTDNDDESFVFPRISNAELNYDLKIIGRLLGLNEKISSLHFKNGQRIEKQTSKAAALTTHSGRHTFAVQALSAGVPGSVLMSWTGHSDYNSLKPYIGITSDAKEKGMAQFEAFIADVFE